MPRSARRLVDGLPYHVLNRGNRRQTIFSQPSDYEVFLTTLADAIVQVPITILSYVTMPNHFHLVLWAERGVEISAFMRWFMNAHIRRHYRFGELWGTGHLYQGRFKAFPIQTGHHLATVLRYVEANPLRARLVSKAEDWPWSSLTQEASDDGGASSRPVPHGKLAIGRRSSTKTCRSPSTTRCGWRRDGRFRSASLSGYASSSSNRRPCLRRKIRSRR